MARLHQHVLTEHHGEGAGAMVMEPATPNEPILGYTTYQDYPEYQVLMERHRDAIRDKDTNRSNWRKVNRELPPNFTYTDLRDLLRGLMRDEVSAFRINIGFGAALYNPIHQQFRYFYISTNQYLFDRADTISTRADMDNFFSEDS